jgi:hypothetical protein
VQGKTRCYEQRKKDRSPTEEIKKKKKEKTAFQRTKKQDPLKQAFQGLHAAFPYTFARLVF